METLLSAAQVAMLLGISPQTLAVWRMTGKYGLSYLKIGGRVRYSKDEVERWLKQRTSAENAEV